MLRPTVSRSVCLGVKHHLRSKTRFLLPSTQWRIRWYKAPSLTGGRVCPLQMLLVLANTVILGSVSRGTHGHILLSQIRDFPNLEAQVSILYSPRTRLPSYITRHWVPFSSHPTTNRAIVAVFKPAPHWGKGGPESEFLYDCRFPANQFVLAPSHLRPTTRLFFLQLNPWGRSPYVTFPLTTEWVCLLRIGFTPVKCTIAHIAYYRKFFLVHYIQVLSQSRLCKTDVYLTFLMLQRQLNHLNSCKPDRRQV
jgi:hypothetical protein